MRHRSCFALALVVCAFAPPAHATHPDSTPAVREPAVPAASVAIAAPTESVHVYLVTQLEVPAALGRDSAALVAHVRHAAVTLVTAFTAESIPIAQGRIVVRSSGAAATSYSDSAARTPRQPRQDAMVSPPVRTLGFLRR
jgi:hypothetical protein